LFAYGNKPAKCAWCAFDVSCSCRSLLPGWTTLTWSTLNIDAFLHRVQASVSSLLSLVERMGDILRGTIHRILGEMERASLFDVELATGRVWVNPQLMELEVT